MVSKIKFELFNIPYTNVNNVNIFFNDCKSLQKVSNDSFDIPENISEFLNYNYNRKQLDAIAKHYKLSCNGLKNALKLRILNFFLIKKYVLILQRIIRGYFHRKFILLHGPAFNNIKLCTNECDFFSLEPLNNIPFENFVSIKDDNGFIYGFDINSIYNLYKINKFVNVINPYNREKFPEHILTTLNSFINFSKLLKNKSNLIIDKSFMPSDDLAKLKLRSLDLFQYIDFLGNYSSNSWFLSLTNSQIIRFIYELYDIWVYRADISHEVKTFICHPSGDPFIHNSLSSFCVSDDNTKLKLKVLNIMENFVYYGIDNSYKSLGAMYILGALTIVNKRVSQELPELFNAFRTN